MAAIGWRNIWCHVLETEVSSDVDSEPPIVGSIDRRSAKRSALPTASARFMAGPAAATSAMSRRGWPILRGSIGNRFGPAEKESSRHKQAEQRQDDGSEGIDVCQRIHGEPALEFGGRIAASIGDPAMGVFVQDHGEEEREPHVGNRVEDLR